MIRVSPHSHAHASMLSGQPRLTDVLCRVFPLRWSARLSRPLLLIVSYNRPHTPSLSALLTFLPEREEEDLQGLFLVYSLLFVISPLPLGGGVSQMLTVEGSPHSPAFRLRITAELKPAWSSSLSPLMVTPPGVVTLSMASSGCQPVSLSNDTAPCMVCSAICLACCG